MILCDKMTVIGTGDDNDGGDGDIAGGDDDENKNGNDDSTENTIDNENGGFENGDRSIGTRNPILQNCFSGDLYSSTTTGNCSFSHFYGHNQFCSLKCKTGLFPSRQFLHVSRNLICYNGNWRYTNKAFFSKSDFYCNVKTNENTADDDVGCYDDNSCVDDSGIGGGNDNADRASRDSCDSSIFQNSGSGYLLSQNCNDANYIKSAGTLCRLICNSGKFQTSKTSQILLTCFEGDWYFSSIEEGGFFPAEVVLQSLVCSSDVERENEDLPFIKNGKYVSSKCEKSEGAVCRFVCDRDLFAMPYDRRRHNKFEGAIWSQNGEWVRPLCADHSFVVEKDKHSLESRETSYGAQVVFEVDWDNCVVDSNGETVCVYSCSPGRISPFSSQKSLLSFISGFTKRSASTWTPVICSTREKPVEKVSTVLMESDFGGKALIRYGLVELVLLLL
ncbi:hypothetical protein MHBO_001993 [Bonamia ostreae]|uniref:Sushi domain-containing protein n=1 Tax=Bonamia ostreae TaxID=126728 RepID=A0ABV2AKU8_9EUKA